MQAWQSLLDFKELFYKHNMKKDAPKDKHIDVNSWLKKSSIAVLI